jgi:hypothetical protein
MLRKANISYNAQKNCLRLSDFSGGIINEGDQAIRGDDAEMPVRQAGNLQK